MRIEIDTTAATIAELQGITALLAAVLMERGGTLYTPEDMRAREGDFPAPLFVVNGGEQFQNGDPAAAFGGSASNVLPFPSAPAAALAADAGAPMVANATPEIAPTASAAAPVATLPLALTATPELDINSIPWDDRIHSTTRAKNQDGTWRYRRNLDPQTRDMVMIELRARAGAAPVPAGTPPLPTPPAAAPPPPPPPVTLPAPGAVPVPTPSPARLPDSSEPNVVPPVSGATPPPPPSGEVVDFNSFIRRVNYACQQLKTHTIAQVQDACKAEGCGNIPDVVNHKDKIPAILARLKL